MPLKSGSNVPRIALIGVSGYGSIYLQLVREAMAAKSIHLVAAVVINPDQVQDIISELKNARASIYHSADELFAREAGNVDLCLIPVGIQWHARLTIAALRAGMNVLVEKPLAGSVADALAIMHAEKTSGRWVALGFQDLYTLESRWLKNQLLGGVIGRVEDVRMIGLWPRPRAYFTRNHWAGRIMADGAAVLDSPLNNAFAHFVNLAFYFAGPEANASSSITVDSAELYRAHRIEMFDTAVVRGRSKSGVRFWFGVSHATATTRQPEICIRGTDGQAEWWHEQRCVVLNTEGNRQIFPLPSTEESRELMFAAVLARLRDPSSFVCTTSIALEHTRFVEAVHAAAPVQPFKASSTEWISEPDSRSETPSVRGLAEELGRAYKDGCSLSSASPFSKAVLASS
jgi:predicted dehydrogenase